MMNNNHIGAMHQNLMAKNLKPYWKLGKLIQHALDEGIITEWEAEAFEVELDLLQKGQNRSHNTIPRAYIEQELDRMAATN